MSLRSVRRWSRLSTDAAIRTLAQAVCTFWFAVAAWTLINGPALRMQAELQVEAAIEQENAVVCERLGMPPASERYPDCAFELNSVRRQHEARLSQAADLF